MATLSWDAEGAELRARTIPSLTAPLMVRCTPPPSPAQHRQVLRTYLEEGRYFVIAPDPAFLALGWVTWPFTLGAGPLFTETEVLPRFSPPNELSPTSPSSPPLWHITSLYSRTPHLRYLLSVHYHRLPLPIPDLYPLNPAENSPMSHLIPKYEAAHGGHEKNGIIYLTLAHLALLYALGTVGHAPGMHGPYPVAGSIKSCSKADALRTQHSDNPLTAPSPTRRVDQLVNWDSAVRSKCPDLEPFVTPSCTALQFERSKTCPDHSVGLTWSWTVPN
ncbi:hypothetical protein CTAM01_01276 [Colletotrichum tamarilloi]|uniref:Uncharacterized protein n=1 Tax=Colletotrichum tamarilloi TaxID=1209934 RepID=A0ABQ9RRY2_9PEZI|nr:uncharacterized protein CTAM01_01276 [Colletotrichum tamarilloi]KAK1510703.1 hypothetical protein CTAM01_01276 [Colletotrichum tamarilloi]